MTTALSQVTFGARLERWLEVPQPVLRLEIVRIFAPLAILGFMTSRISHADEWLGDAGFRVPDLAKADYRQPLFIPALPDWAAWSIAIALAASGLLVALGFRARQAAIVFALTSAFVALSDRLSAFSVSKMAPVIAITLALSPCGSRFGVDAWLRKRQRTKLKLPTHVVSGSVRFIQLLVPVIYCASGIAKIRGDWLHHSHVLWTHLHDSYQTPVALALANILPASAWTVLQAITLGFETLAPLLFAHPRTRTGALIVGVGMHTMIGLMFGPVLWFAILMATLLVSAFLPDRLLDRAAKRIKIF
jgi:uncharacterized membrane protein YphA (DoxX/SURF4 family)